MELTCRRRMTSMSVWIAALIFSAISISTSFAVKITNLEVPALIEFGVNDSIILGCDYELGNSSEGLVVKWYFDSTHLIYQWIANIETDWSKMLKGKLDLNFTASDEGLKSRSALRILDPGLDMSGSYTCKVSTFSGEDSITKEMVIYSGEHNMDLTARHKKADEEESDLEGSGDKEGSGDEKENEDEDGSGDEEENVQLLLVCSVEDVYPQPILVIKRIDSLELYTAVPNQNVTVTNNTNGLYSAEARALDSPVLKAPRQFSCELMLPQANYTAKRVITVPPVKVAPNESLPVNSTALNSSLPMNSTKDGATQVIIETTLLIIATAILSIC